MEFKNATQNKLYILTGPSGVGKTTLSYKLADVLKDAIVINADDIYHAENKENIAPWEDGAEKITHRMWKRCFDLIKQNLKLGKSVVFNYLINRKELETIITNFSNYECHFVCLMANENELIKRDDIKPGEMQYERIKVHIKELNNQKFGKYVLNTTAISVDEEIKEIFTGRFQINRNFFKLNDVKKEL